MITNATPLQRFDFGPLWGVLLGEIESPGTIQYAYVLAVVPKGEEDPVYFVASEVNALGSPSGPDSHFLCAFEDDRHLNYGLSADWADRGKFTDKALEMVATKFELERATFREVP